MFAKLIILFAILSLTEAIAVPSSDPTLMQLDTEAEAPLPAESVVKRDKRTIAESCQIREFLVKIETSTLLTNELFKKFIRCGNKHEYMSSLDLEGPLGTPVEAFVRFRYTCCPFDLPGYKKLSGNYMKGTTSQNEFGGGLVMYLDRHKINCGPTGMLKGISLLGTTRTMNYFYECNKSISKQPECTDEKTISKPLTRNITGLVGLEMNCGAPRYLNNFQLAVDHANGEMHYNYRCCSV